MKETGLTGKRRSITIAATPDDGNSQRKRRCHDTGNMYANFEHFFGTRHDYQCFINFITKTIQLCTSPNNKQINPHCGVSQVTSVILQHYSGTL